MFIGLYVDSIKLGTAASTYLLCGSDWETLMDPKYKQKKFS